MADVRLFNAKHTTLEAPPSLFAQLLEIFGSLVVLVLVYKHASFQQAIFVVEQILRRGTHMAIAGLFNAQQTTLEAPTPLFAQLLQLFGSLVVLVLLLYQHASFQQAICVLEVKILRLTVLQALARPLVAIQLQGTLRRQ